MINQIVLNIKVAIDAITPVAVFASTEKSVNDVYKHVLLKCNGEQIFAISCNGSQSVIRTLKMSGIVMEAFELCLDAVKLRAVLAGFKDATNQDMTLSWDDVAAVVKVGRSKLTIPVIDPSSFPYPDKLTDETFSAILPASVFVESIKSTSHACAHRDVRYYLNGCHLKFAAGIFSVTGTDGHRVSRVIKNVNTESSQTSQGIIPTKFIDLIQSNLGKSGDIRVRMNTNMIEVTWHDGQLRSTLIDGQFPDTNAIFDGGNTELFKCSRTELMQSISRLRATLFEKLPSLTINLSKEGEVKLSTLDEQKNESGVDYLDALIMAHTETELSINLMYLSDVLAIMSHDEIAFSLCVGNGIKIKQVSDDSFNTVIAQLRR